MSLFSYEGVSNILINPIMNASTWVNHVICGGQHRILASSSPILVVSAYSVTKVDYSSLLLSKTACKNVRQKTVDANVSVSLLIVNVITVTCNVMLSAVVGARET